MVAYDFSLHLVELLRELGVIERYLHPLPVGKLFDWLSVRNKEKRKKVYQIFWSIYWGTASILAIIYLLSLT